MNYITVKKAADDRFEEKKSVFIGYVKRVTTEEEAKEFVAEINNKHKDARHNCYAYVIAVSYTHLDVYKRQSLGLSYPIQIAAE